MEGENQKVDQAVVDSKRGKPWSAIIIIIALIAIAVAGYFVFGRQSQEGKSSSSVTTDVRWQINNDGNYQASGTPPACPSPLVLPPPTDISKVISILYPGQYRGNDYKAHGGFRFTDGQNEQVVTVPMDATVVAGSRYLEEGEVQYLFDFVNPCGIKYRLDHLGTLTAPFAALAEKFPEAKNMDSRTTLTDSSVKVKAGDVVATVIGLLGTGNAFFDFGVYDLRQANEASKSTTFQTEHSNDKDMAWHGVCWFDLLSAENEAKARNLPATAQSSQSDYCD